MEHVCNMKICEVCIEVSCVLLHYFTKHIFCVLWFALIRSRSDNFAEHKEIFCKEVDEIISPQISRIKFKLYAAVRH